MKHDGYINEHGHAGVHKAYGIRMSYHYMRDAKYYIFDSQLQQSESNIHLFYPLVQVVGSDGIVHECQIDYLVGDVAPEDTIRLKFNPAFTGWVLCLARIFNNEMFNHLSIIESSYEVEHELDAIGFTSVVDSANSLIGSDIQIIDNDNIEINVSPATGIRGAVHGLRSPMFRKYKVDATESPYKCYIKHCLGASGLVRPPYVMVADDVGHLVDCQIKHLNMSEIELSFTESFSGKAYLLMG